MLLYVEAFALAFVGCVATNIDNMLLVLSAGNPHRARQSALLFVVILEVYILLALLVSYGVDLSIPRSIVWLGLIPFSIGVYELRPWRKTNTDSSNPAIEGEIDFDTELELDEIDNTLLGDGLDLWASDEEAGGLETNAAGVRVQLSTGQVCQVRLDTKIMNKLLGCLTLPELESFVQQIALAVENPTDSPLCEL